jgi:hypothetical protein
MQNSLLGEIEIALEGKKYILRPTFQSLILTEELAKKSVAEMTRAFMSAKTSLSDVTAIIYGGMFGANGDKHDGLPTMEQIGGMVMRTGVLNLSGACGFVVGAAYSGKPIEELVKAREAIKRGDVKPKEAQAEQQQVPQPIN